MLLVNFSCNIHSAIWFLLWFEIQCSGQLLHASHGLPLTCRELERPAGMQGVKPKRAGEQLTTDRVEAHYLTTSLPHYLTTSLPHYLTTSLLPYLPLRIFIGLSLFRARDTTASSHSNWFQGVGFQPQSLCMTSHTGNKKIKRGQPLTGLSSLGPHLKNQETTTLHFHSSPISFLSRFDINLCCDCVDEERAFHFNPRFFQNETVRNSKLGGGYGDEETDGDFPFEAGKVYRIDIQVQDDYYKVDGEPAVMITSAIDWHCSSVTYWALYSAEAYGSFMTCLWLFRCTWTVGITSATATAARLKMSTI